MQAKADLINARQSPIEYADIEYYLADKSLDLTATTDKQCAYADFVIIATPTDYDPDTNYLNTQSVEAVIKDVLAINPRDTLPVCYT